MRTALCILPLALVGCADVSSEDELSQTTQASSSHAQLTLEHPKAAIAQTSQKSWSLANAGAVDTTTSSVTWTLTATQTPTGAKRLTVTGSVTIENDGSTPGTIGNVVVTLEHKPGHSWTAASSDVANATAGDAAHSAKIVRSDDDDDDDWGHHHHDDHHAHYTVRTVVENSASGALAFSIGTNHPYSLVPEQSIAPHHSLKLGFSATFDNDVLGLPVGRDVRAQVYVTFGNAGTGATNVDINGNGSINADEAHVRTASSQLNLKKVAAPTNHDPLVAITDGVADLSTTGTVAFSNPVFTLGGTSGTVRVTYAGGASGGSITDCAHLTGPSTALTTCNTQPIAPESSGGFAWHDGDVVTYAQTDWGDSSSAAGQLLIGNFASVYHGGAVVIGLAGHSNTFTNPNSILDYVPRVGPSGALTMDLVDPSQSEGGAFAGDVLAFQLDVDFADAGVIAGATANFGNVTLCGVGVPGLQGATVRDVLGIANTLLGGGTSTYTIGQLEGLTSTLTQAFPGGVASTFANDHLVVGACP